MNSFLVLTKPFDMFSCSRIKAIGQRFKESVYFQEPVEKWNQIKFEFLVPDVAVSVAT